MTTKIDFEDFLQDEHMDAEPMTLDDDLPDAFNSWLEMDTDEIIAYGQKFGEKCYLQGKEEMLKQIEPTMEIFKGTMAQLDNLTIRKNLADNIITKEELKSQQND